MDPLALLPLLAFSTAFLAFFQLDRDEASAFIRATLAWGAFAVLVSELLSLVHGVTTAGLSLAWSAAIGAGGWMLWRRARKGPLAFPRISLPSSPLLRVVAAAIAAIVILTAAVAWFAPPNTWDALTYHMTRVAHWAQNGSIGHYATGIDAQNFMPPGASIFALTTYVLGGSDRLANFVQWFAMVGCLVVAPRIAARLGSGETGRWFTAAFVATLPVGIMQATGVTTDYIVALWVAIAVLSSVELWLGQGGPQAALRLGVAAGLAFVTKQTALPYLAVFAVVLPFVLLRRPDRRRLAMWVVLGLLFLGLLNIGHAARNLSTYGDLAGPASRVETQANQILDARVLVSNLLRNASLHAGTPSPHVNKAIALAIGWAHRLIGLDPNDPRTTSEGVFRVKSPTLHDTVAGNLVHALLLAILVPLGWLVRRRIPRFVWIYTGLVLLTFVFLSALLQWKPTGARYQLPFFVLLAPVAGMILEAFPRTAVSHLAVVALLVTSLPWLLGNHSRPLLSGWPGAQVDSVLVVPRDELIFANAPYLAQPYREMGEMLQASGCGRIAVALPGNGLEYPLWSMLGAPRQDLRIEWLVAGTASARYTDERFTPCAVVCEKCPESWTTVRELPERYHYGSFRLYLETLGDS